MATDFETGAFNGQLQLLDFLNTFLAGPAAGNGILINSYAADLTSLSNMRLVLQFTSPNIYLSMRTFITGAGAGNSAGTRPRIKMAAHSSAPNLALAFNVQPGGYGDSTWEGISVLNTSDDDVGNPTTLSSNYWFFSDNNWLIIVLEIGQGSGWFQTFFAGQLNMFTGVNNGFMVYGTVHQGVENTDRGDYDNIDNSGTITNSNNQLYQSCFCGGGGNGTGSTGHLRTHAGGWMKVDNADPAPAGTPNAEAYLPWNRGGNGNTGTRSKVTIFQERWTTNPTNIVAPLTPCIVHAASSTVSGKFCPTGIVPGAFVVPTDSIGEAEELVIGSDEYLVFPGWRTRRVDHFFRYLGIAVKKN